MITEYEPVDTVTVEEIDGDICLLLVETGEVVILNATASDIWLLVTEGMNVADIVERMASAYGLPPADVAADVGRVLSELRAGGFVSERR